VDAWQPDPLRVRVDIRDEGRGLTPEEERALFTILPPSTGGTGGLGLGLAIARLVVEAHGGTIGAVTTREQGTTWWVELPVLA
jgi:signal transduction histidine kinase